MTEHDESEVARLRKQLRDAEEKERKAQAERKKATEKRWRFTLEVSDGYPFDRLQPDCGVVVYRLTGMVDNEEECRAAGHSSQDLSGSMGYFFNEATGKIVCPTGGGRIFIHDTGDWHGDLKTYETYRRLEEFLRTSPEGGDVTEIILSQPNFR
jgi:hypothetical protein